MIINGALKAMSAKFRGRDTQAVKLKVFEFHRRHLCGRQSLVTLNLEEWGEAFRPFLF